MVVVVQVQGRGWEIVVGDARAGLALVWEGGGLVGRGWIGDGWRAEEIVVGRGLEGRGEWRREGCEGDVGMRWGGGDVFRLCSLGGQTSLGSGLC